MDSDILETLYRKYYRRTLLYCLSLCGEESLAQDIATDAFLKAYLSLPNNAPSFPYWILRVCKNLWIDHMRKQTHLASDEFLQFAADISTPEIRYLQNERSRILWNAIQSLSPIDRELVVLHYFSGLSLQEAAQILGKRYDATRQRMVRLRTELKLRLEEQGYGPEL